jgi:RNA polymerase sigma-70 factor (ECF subfamily)
MTDRELLLAYVELRDAASLGVLLERHQDSLLRFVSRLLGDPHAAQDVVQETFLEAARHPQRLLRVDSCQNWLLRVARNRSVDWLRKETRRRRHTEAAALRSESSSEDAGPAASSERAERCAAMRREIDRLPPRQKEVLLLRIEAGKSYREIAEITGYSSTNVGYILHRTMKDLSARLAPGEGRNT